MALKRWYVIGPVVAAFAIGGLIGNGLYRHDLAEIRAEVAQNSQLIETIAGRVEYATRGDGVPLLVIHGAGGGYDQGLMIADGFIGQGFKVIAPSRFGYLRTPVPPDTSPAAQAGAHAALLDALGIDKPVVVGVSAGAPSAIQVALCHPDRITALILIVPASYAPGHKVEVDQSVGSQLVLRIVMAGADFAWWTASKLARPLLVRFLGVPPNLEAAAPIREREKVTAIIDSVLPLSERLPGLQIDSTSAMEPLPLEAIAAPTLIITAADDLFNTLPAAHYLDEGIPDAKLVVYDTGGHLLVGHEDAVRRTIAEFLAAVGVSVAPKTSRRSPALAIAGTGNWDR